MKCDKLPQKEANNILESCLEDLNHFPEFANAFQDEAKRRAENEDFCALPQMERIYYTVTLDDHDNPYLMLGLNSKFLNISSVAKVVNDEERMGTCSLKFFIENILLEKLRKSDPTRNTVSAIPSTESGKRLFQRLREDPPKGITSVTVSETYPYNVTIKYEP